MKKSDDVYRRQIVDAVAKIESFVASLDRDAFLASEVVQSAVIMQLAVIGELSKRSSDEFKKRVFLPSKQIAGFRDRAVHDYYQLDQETELMEIGVLRDDHESIVPCITPNGFVHCSRQTNIPDM